MDTAIPASAGLPTSASPAGAPGTALPVYGVRGEYQDPDTTMTLREGLAEYYRVNPGLADPATIEDEDSARWFHNHDATHVVFGTHTGPLDEGVNDMLTMFGVQLPYRTYITGFFGTEEGKDIIKEYMNPAMLAKLTWQTLKVTPTAWRMTRAMAKKWPWAPPDELLDRPLNELRAEFGIAPFRPNEVLGLVDEPA